MKRLLIWLLLLCTAVVPQAQILTAVRAGSAYKPAPGGGGGGGGTATEVRIDFRATSTSITGVNVVSGSPGSSLVTVDNLLDKDGNATTWDVSTISTTNWLGYSGGTSNDAVSGITGGTYLGASTPSIPASVYQSIWYQYSNSASQSPGTYDAAKPQIRISGLNPNRIYTLKMTGSDGTLGFLNEARYRVSGLTSPAATDYTGDGITNLTGGATFTLQPSAGGIIDVWVNTITGGGGGAVACISGITITQEDYDTDAQAFFTASGITDDAIKDAVNILVVDLKNNSLWTLAYAIYPIVGGTAATHKWNLKDPRDLDAAYRLTFAGPGSWTHSSTGMAHGATSAHANTYLTPSAIDNTNGVMSMGIYIRNNISGTIVDMGAYNATGTKYFQIWSRFGDTFYGNVNTTGVSPNVGNTDSRGWYFASRSSATSTFLQKNATQSSPVSVTVGVPNVPVFIGARNDDGAAGFGTDNTHQYAFGWLGGGLSTTQGTTLYNIVIKFLTTLGRNV